MKNLFVLSFILMIASPAVAHSDKDAKSHEHNFPVQVARGSRCTGSASCSACSNCSRCAYCSGGGTCGVCSGTSSGRSFSGGGGNGGSYSHSSYSTATPKPRRTPTPHATPQPPKPLPWEFTAKVVAIIDGDTITVKTKSGRSMNIRIHGIDAPELRQHYGQESRKSLTNLSYGSTVTLQVSTSAGRRSGKGETIEADVIAPRGNLAKEQLKRGMAWAFSASYMSYEESQKEAESSKSGLWADSNPIPPWEFRRKKS